MLNSNIKILDIMSESLTEIDEFLDKLNDYEPGIIDIIKKYSYTFENNEEIRHGMYLWNNNKNECIERYGHISDWNTSNITDMYALICHNDNFNEDISRWDTSKVTNMKYMFYRAHSFKQDLSRWNTSNVIDKENMFDGCYIPEEYKPVF